MPYIEPFHPSFHLEVLNAEQLEATRLATLHILERIGGRFPYQRALGVFDEHPLLGQDFTV